VASVLLRSSKKGPLMGVVGFIKKGESGGKTDTNGKRRGCVTKGKQRRGFAGQVSTVASCQSTATKKKQRSRTVPIEKKPPKK